MRWTLIISTFLTGIFLFHTYYDRESIEEYLDYQNKTIYEAMT